MKSLRKKSILLICIALLVCLAAAGTAFAEGSWLSERNLETGEWETVYLDDNGARVTGFQKIDGYIYYFDENGVRVTGGWRTIDGEKYYLNPNAIVGFYTLKDEEDSGFYTFSFDDNGKMQTGWVKKNDRWYYFDGKGRRAAGGWLTLGSDKYYLYENGDPYAMTGLTYIYDQKTGKYDYYYFDDRGKMQVSSWITIDDRKYYYGSDGKRASGWLTLGKDKYYICSSGYAVTGRYYVSDDSATFCFDANGKMQTGLVTVDEKSYDDDGQPVTLKRKYYYGSDGKEVSGLVKIGNDTYGFQPFLRTGSFYIYNSDTGETAYYYSNSEGKIQTGFVSIEETDYSGNAVTRTYYFGKDGKRQTGWITVDGDTYYLNSYLMTGLRSVYNSEEDKYDYYYFNDEGKMQTGFVSVEETDYSGNAVTRTYYFGTDGKRQTGWVQVGEDWYYLNYALTTGLTSIYDKTEQKSWYYYFDDKGRMQTGLVRVDDTDYYGNATTKTYYFGTDGKAVSGWKEIGSDWYYFSEYGYAAYTGFYYVKDNYYLFNSAGVMQTGWCDTGDDYRAWRLFGSDGAMVTSFEGMSSVTIPAKVTSLKTSTFSGIGRDFVIYCEPGSYAEKFAIRNGLQYNNGQKEVVGYQIKSVNEKVKWVVENYTTPEMSDMEKVRALHDWLIHNAHYDTTYSSYSASGVLLRGSGVCASYADAFQLLMNAAGIENKYVSGKADNGTGSGPQGHAWNMVKLGDNWYHVDCTWDDPTDLDEDVPIISGWEGYSYFLISDKTISADHFWSSSVKALSDMVWWGDPGWAELEGGGWLYFDSDGFLTTGAARIDGTLYGFTSDGVLINSGWLEADGNYYYAAANGILLENEWVQDGSAWYYLGTDGRMATGWVKIDGDWYCFSDKGAMRTGWVQDGSDWYYFAGSGKMVTGWTCDGSNWYYMTPGGAMATGWVKDGSDWYLFSGSGIMQTGWVQDGGGWYYFGSSGRMATGWIQDGGTWYYMTSGGRMATGWVQIGSAWYYMNSRGIMLTGWQEIDGQWEMFADSGVWLYTWQGN